MAQQVTKSTMIGELLQINENIAPLLLNIGMHCLGCPSSQMETIEEAAMVHGIQPDALVTQINDFLAKMQKETGTCALYPVSFISMDCIDCIECTEILFSSDG